MEEGREALHDQEDGHSEGGKGSEDEEQRQTSCQALHAQADVDHHGPKHLRQLCGPGRHDIWFSLARGTVGPVLGSAAPHLKRSLQPGSPRPYWDTVRR